MSGRHFIRKSLLPSNTPGSKRIQECISLELPLLNGELYDHNDKNEQCNELICTHESDLHSCERMALRTGISSPRCCFAPHYQNMRSYTLLVLHKINNSYSNFWPTNIKRSRSCITVNETFSILNTSTY